jgi:hypothetical protein
MNISKSTKVGDIIQFGESDWRVLDIQDGKALLLSEKVLGQRAYNTESYDITWERCALRQYLNTEFYNKLGTAKASIATTDNQNPDNQWYGTNGGNATQDKVFLLSLDEVVKYFGDSGDLRNRKGWTLDRNYNQVLNNTGDRNKDYWINDRYNDSRIAYNDLRTAYDMSNTSKAWWWWLRSPGSSSLSAARVGGDGRVRVNGNNVIFDGNGVRPALWLNLE